MGNHRDAWGYGAADPSSGTATMMEVAKILGQMVKEKKWRPRRTIVFASWASEEYGLMGSYEWLEDKRHKIMERANIILLGSCRQIKLHLTKSILWCPIQYRINCNLSH